MEENKGEPQKRERREGRREGAGRKGGLGGGEGGGGGGRMDERGAEMERGRGGVVQREVVVFFLPLLFGWVRCSGVVSGSLLVVVVVVSGGAGRPAFWSEW